MNRKKKSTNTSPYPDEAIDRLARAFYPAILACWNSEEGQREFAVWQAEQAHISGKEKQEVPAGELPVVHIIVVCGFWQGASSRAHPVLFFQNCALIRAQRSSRFRVVAQQLFRTGPALRQGDRYFVSGQVAQH